jgi:hypothetical protein
MSKEHKARRCEPLSDHAVLDPSLTSSASRPDVEAQASPWRSLSGIASRQARSGETAMSVCEIMIEQPQLRQRNWRRLA